MQSKRYLFFLRHHNDIDNISPVIFYFLAESETHYADIVFYYEKIRWEKDPNIRFLLQRFPDRLTVASLPNLVPRKQTTAFRQLCDRLVRSARKRLSLPYEDGDDLRTGRLGLDHVRRILNEYIKTAPPTCLAIFDVVRVQMVKGLLQGLRDSGITRIVCLPVSPLINYNVMRADWMTDPRAEAFQQELNYSAFDAIGFVDPYFVRSVSTLQGALGIETPWLDKAAILGSARYCSQWLSVRQGFTPPFSVATNKKKIVIFPSRKESNVFWEEFLRVLRIANRHSDRYHVIVKQHPRMRSELRVSETDGLHFETDVDSSALIDWADAVLFWSSSVALEGYAKGKFMVCMDYLVANRTVYADFSAGYVARARDDVELFFLLFADAPERLAHNSTGAVELLRSIVSAAGPDVPGMYLEFLRKHEHS